MLVCKPNRDFLKLRSFAMFIAMSLVSFQLLALPNNQPDIEIGFPLIQTYTPKDYDAFAQNWAITQTPDGFIYIGNTDGVLKFDGVDWQLIRIPGNSVVRSLDVDPLTGRLFVGVIGDFGYLDSNESDQLSFVSLKGMLPERDRQFADVWNTFFTKDGVYFFTQKKLFLVNDNQITHWESDSSFHRSFKVGERIFIREREKGLLELVEGKLQLVSGGEAFAKEGISFIVPWEKDEEEILLLSSINRGFISFDGKAFEDWPSTDVNKLSSSYTAFKLGDGRLVIGTLQHGLLIYGKDGYLQSQINQESGLPDNAIYALNSDLEGGLWVATDRGIARLEMHNPLTLFDERSGLKGQVLKTIRFNQSLYSATSNGVFRFNVKKETKFEQVKGINNITFDLLPFRDKLVMANHSGIFQLHGDRVTRLLNYDTETAFALANRVNRANQILVGDRQGAAVLEYKNEQWIEHRIPSIDLEVREIMMVSDSELWLATNNNGLVKVTLPVNWPNSGPPTIQKYGISHGLLAVSGINILTINNEVRFATEQGLLQFDELKDQFIQDPLFAELSEARNLRISKLQQLSDDRYWAIALREENDELKSYFGLITHESTQLKWKSSYFSALNGQRVNSAYFDLEQTLWFGNETGLYRYAFDTQEPIAASYNVHLRKVSDSIGHIIYSGLEESDYALLDYKQNTLRFDYSATSFDNPEQTLFQVKLLDEDDWSSWNTSPSVTYSNLKEGKYAFSIRAKNRNELISEPKRFIFEIAPPWYRSFVFYLSILSGVGIGFLIWRDKKQKSKHELVNVNSVNEPCLESTESDSSGKAEKELVEASNNDEYELKEIEPDEQLTQDLTNTGLKRLKLQIGAKIWLVPIEDIVCILAYGRYVKVITENREGLIRMPLKKIFQKLDADNFWQIHRSTIINVNFLDYVGNADSERMTVNMKGMKEPLQISKSYSAQFRSST